MSENKYGDFVRISKGMEELVPLAIDELKTSIGFALQGDLGIEDTENLAWEESVEQDEEGIVVRVSVQV